MNVVERLPKTPRVFVHLAAGHDAQEWSRRFYQGALLGINDPSPYGYARANEMGCQVTFSEPGKGGMLEKVLRLALRGILGFDYVHARANRRKIFDADVVWTHTESQFLAVAAVLALAKSHQHKPRLIGQSVWLFDKWSKLWFFQRWLYRHLIDQVDILTVLSPENARIAKRLFPRKHVEFVKFGIPNEMTEQVHARDAEPIRVLCLGNDRHRDWPTAVAALANQTGIELTILSATAHASLAHKGPNVKIVRVSDNDELLKYLRDASLMLVPLKTNFHASGITVVQEAALFGLPVIATDTGGLKAYFGDNAVQYVSPGDPDAILREVRKLAANPEAMRRQAARAQSRMLEPDMGCTAYVRRHVDMAHDLVHLNTRG